MNTIMRSTFVCISTSWQQSNQRSVFLASRGKYRIPLDDLLTQGESTRSLIIVNCIIIL